MKLQFTLVMALLCCFATSFAQSEDEFVENFGRIPLIERTTNNYDFDADAEAIYLLDKIKCYSNADGNGIGVKYIFHQRIKILKKSAAQTYGKIDLVFFPFENEQIYNIKAQIVHENGALYPINTAEIKTIKNKRGYMVKQIIFPNVQIGHIIELQYYKTSPNIYNLNTWFCQKEIPILHTEYTLDCSSILGYIFLSKGNIKIKDQRILGYGRNKLFYSADSVASVKEEPFVISIKENLPSIRFYLSMKERTWLDLNKYLIEDEYFGKQYLKKENYIHIWKILEPELNKISSEEGKIEKIYNFINQNVEWDESFGKYCDDELNKVFKLKKANSGTLNCLLIALLNHIGIKARPVLVSTKEYGKIEKDYPILAQFNHVLCYYQLNGKDYFLDAGNKLRPKNLIRADNFNEDGLVVDDKKLQWIELTPPVSNETALMNFSVAEDGSISGKIDRNLSAYKALEMRTLLENEMSDNKKIKEKIAAQLPNTQINNVLVQNFDKIDDNLKLTLECTIPNHSIISDNLMYLKPTFNNELEENPFKLENRLLPIELPFPYRTNIILNYSIPENFTVEELPKSAKFSYGAQQDISFQYVCTANNGKIQISIKFQCLRTYFLATEYADLKNIFNNIAEKMQEQIVLKKVK